MSAQILTKHISGSKYLALSYNSIVNSNICLCKDLGHSISIIGLTTPTTYSYNTDATAYILNCDMTGSLVHLQNEITNVGAYVGGTSYYCRMGYNSLSSFYYNGRNVSYIISLFICDISDTSSGAYQLYTNCEVNLEALRSMLTSYVSTGVWGKFTIGYCNTGYHSGWSTGIISEGCEFNTNNAPESYYTLLPITYNLKILGVMWTDIYIPTGTTKVNWQALSTKTSLIKYFNNTGPFAIQPPVSNSTKFPYIYLFKQNLSSLKINGYKISCTGLTSTGY